MRYFYHTIWYINCKFPSQSLFIFIFLQKCLRVLDFESHSKNYSPELAYIVRNTFYITYLSIKYFFRKWHVAFQCQGLCQRCQLLFFLGEHGFRSWIRSKNRSGSSTNSKDDEPDDMLDDEESSEEVFCNPWALKCHRDHLKKMGLLSPGPSTPPNLGKHFFKMGRSIF